MSEKIKCIECGLELGQIEGISFHWEVDWNGHICSICDGEPNKLIDRIIENVVEKRLIKLGIRIGYCRGCNKKIVYLPTKNGKLMPTCLNLISHFSDCPKAKDFKK